MLAELKNGETVCLNKECNCFTHNEPHWVWLDNFEREQNKGLPVPEKELARLDEKLRNMNRLGIVRLIREPSDDLSELQKEQIKQHTLQTIEANARKKNDEEKRLKDSFVAKEKVTNIKSLGTYKTANSILAEFDEIKSDDRRKRLDKKAEVERKAKEAI